MSKQYIIGNVFYNQTGNRTVQSKSYFIKENESGGGSNENVIAGSGSLTLVGGNAVISQPISVSADTGTLTLVGGNAIIGQGEVTPADTGVLGLTGGDALVLTVDTVIAGSGALSLAGGTAIIAVEAFVDGDTGILSLTGGSADITEGEDVALETGNLTLVGSNSLVLLSDTVTGDAGILTLTGSNAVVSESEVISLDAGSLVLLGGEASILEAVASDVPADSGSLNLTGNSADVVLTDLVVADTGVLTITGNDGAIDIGVTADTGTLSLSGSNASVAESISASSGTLILTGRNAVIVADSSAITLAETGTLALFGSPAIIIESQQVIGSSGVITLTGYNATVNEEIFASSGGLSFTGNPAFIVANDNVPASTGTLTLVGGSAFIGATLPPVSGGIKPTIPFDELLRQKTELIPMRNQILLDNVEMERLRTYKALWKRLQNICDYQLNDPPQAVVTFDPDAIYSTQAGVNPVKDKFYFDSEKAYRHGLCYQITGETKYAVKAQQIIDDWAFKLREINGSVPQGYINLHITYFIISATWVRNVEGWDGSLFEDFLVNKLEHLSRWERPNNIGAWGMLFNIAQASYMNDVNRLSDWSIAIQQQILEQVSSTGVMLEEVTRNGGKSGISYSNFGMLPWVIACEILYKEGYDIFNSPAGERLGLAYKRIMEWILNPEEFPYYSGDVTLMNSPWQVTYIYIMQKYYEDANADIVMSMKTRQEPNSFMIDFLYGFMWNPTIDIAKYG